MKRFLIFLLCLFGLVPQAGRAQGPGPEDVELHMTEPDRPYRRLELITAKGDNLIKKLKAKAAALGADAIMEFRIQTTSYGSGGNGGDVFSGLPGTETVGTAWAIQWEDQEKP